MFLRRGAVVFIIGIIAMLTLVANFAGAQPISISCIANGQNFNSAGDINSCITSTIPIAAIGLIVTFMLVAIAYLLGETLGIAQLKGWYRNELLEGVKSVLVLITVFTVIGIFGSVASSFSNYGCGNAGLGSLYCNASGYLNQQSGLATDALHAAIGVSLGTAFIKELEFATYVPFPLPVPNQPSQFFGSVSFGSQEKLLKSQIIETDPIEGGQSILNMINVYLITPMTILIGVQAFLIYTTVYIGLAIFIPLGIVLRAVPFLRGIGGTLIAVGVGLSIVYPMLLVGLNQQISSYFIPTYTSVQYSSCGSGFGSDIVGAILCTLYSGVVEILGFGAINTPLFAAIGTPGVIGYSSGLYSLANGIYGPLNILILFSIPLILQLLLFILDLIIGLSFVGAVAKMLGGTLRLGIGKFRLA